MLYSYVMYATQSNAVPWQIWLFILGGAAMIVGPAIAIGMNYRRLHKQPEESPPPVYTEINTRATVVDLACWVRMAGSYKAPKAVQEFAVVFQTEDGEMIKNKMAHISHTAHACISPSIIFVTKTAKHKTPAIAVIRPLA